MADEGEGVVRECSDPFNEKHVREVESEEVDLYLLGATAANADGVHHATTERRERAARATERAAIADMERCRVKSGVDASCSPAGVERTEWRPEISGTTVLQRPLTAPHVRGTVDGGRRRHPGQSSCSPTVTGKGSPSKTGVPQRKSFHVEFGQEAGERGAIRPRSRAALTRSAIRSSSRSSGPSGMRGQGMGGTLARAVDIGDDVFQHLPLKPQPRPPSGGKGHLHQRWPGHHHRTASANMQRSRSVPVQQEVRRQDGMNQGEQYLQRSNRAHSAASQDSYWRSSGMEPPAQQAGQGKEPEASSIQIRHSNPLPRSLHRKAQASYTFTALLNGASLEGSRYAGKSYPDWDSSGVVGTGVYGLRGRPLSSGGSSQLMGSRSPYRRAVSGRGYRVSSS